MGLKIDKYELKGLPMDHIRKIIKENITIKERTVDIPTDKAPNDIIPGDVVKFLAPETFTPKSKQEKKPDEVTNKATEPEPLDTNKATEPEPLDLPDMNNKPKANESIMSEKKKKKKKYMDPEKSKLGIVLKINRKTNIAIVGILEPQGRNATNDKTRWQLTNEKTEIPLGDLEVIKKKDTISKKILRTASNLAKGAVFGLAGAYARGSAQADKYMDK